MEIKMFVARGTQMFACVTVSRVDFFYANNLFYQFQNSFSIARIEALQFIFSTIKWNCKFLF